MSVKDPSCFACEIHFHIPNKVASYFAPSSRSLDALLEHLESYSNLGHFLGKSVFPERVVVASVDHHSIFNTSRYLYTVLVGGLSDSCIHLGEDYVTLA